MKQTLAVKTLQSNIVFLRYIALFSFRYITRRDCKAGWLWIRSPLEEMIFFCLNLYFHFFALVSRKSAALSSTTQHAMPPEFEFGRKWGTKCLNSRFPLPTLQCAGYSVKLILFNLPLIMK